ncbi:MAG: UDP-glucose/GDP-mannose dehydrogenase family protein [Candidatus Berkiella sp.]
MKVTVYGSGYVGLVLAACFAEVGNEVVCMDVDKDKISRLQQGVIPIYEPGLQEVVISTLKSKRLQFTTDAAMAVKHGDCQFIAVGTPPDANGKADLKYVLAVAGAIGEHMQRHTIIINKSTVPIGTADKVRETIRKALHSRKKEIPFDVVSNPEFLKEGAALSDFRKPDRIVLGVDNQAAANALRKLYEPFNRDNNRLMVMDTRSAELTKYAANAMLATKISFMNEMANLAEKVGADIEKVRIGIGADPRIGYHFTYAGCGYGGSCFGKDIQALIHTAEEFESKAEVVQAVERVNDEQKMRLFEKIATHFNGQLEGKVFAVWGLSFKPETDDMRDAPSLTMLRELFKAGAKVKVYDPKAMIEAQKIFGDRADLTYCTGAEEALVGAHGLIVLTEWRVFRCPDFYAIKEQLVTPVIFDGRNIYDPILLKELGITYYGIGRTNVARGPFLVSSRLKDEVLAG